MTIHWCGTGLSAIPGLRRLIEAGVRVVSLSISDFDTHSSNFSRMRNLLNLISDRHDTDSPSGRDEPPKHEHALPEPTVNRVIEHLSPNQVRERCMAGAADGGRLDPRCGSTPLKD